jgi:hypothetical protein
MPVFSKLFYRLYCSAVWSTTSVLSAGNVSRLQHVQNFAVRIISGTRKIDHITPVLKTLVTLVHQNTTVPERSVHFNV